MPVSMNSSLMSRRRTLRPLIRYSLRPSAYRRRVTSTSSVSTGSPRWRTAWRLTAAPASAPSSSTCSEGASTSASRTGGAGARRACSAALSVGLSKTSVTLAMPHGLRVALPAKMTSSIAPPRRLFALRSPSTHLMASTTFDLPQPLGPTTPMIGWSNRNSVASAKLLKPLRTSRERRKVDLLSVVRRGPSWSARLVGLL